MRVSKLLSVACTGVAVVALVACGNDTQQADAPAEIRAALSDVDSAIVDEKYPDAGQALRELKRLVIEAQAAGTLSDEQSSEILSAADRLMGSLEADQPQEGVVSPTPVVTKPEANGDKGDAKPKEEKPKDEKPTEGEDKPDKSGGPGNSENAPGHQDD